MKKYRAWDRVERVMCPVKIINFDKGAFLIGNSPSPDRIQGRSIVMGPPEGHFVYFEYLVLMESTGINDIKGNDIYEGDIIEIEDVGRAEVIFQAGCFMAKWIDDPEALMDAVGFRMKNGHKWESIILGNKFENPELLKNENVSVR